MSALVCRKRSYFEDSNSEWSSLKAPKRVRSGGSPVRRLPASPRRGSEGGAAGAGATGSLQEALEQLRTHFPKMDTQVMVQVLQTCENNVEAAIKCLTDLRLTPQQEVAEAASLPPYAPAPSLDGRGHSQGSGSAPVPGMPQPSAAEDPAGRSDASGAAGAEWVEVVVREMLAAGSLDDARARAAKVLAQFEGAVRERGESGGGAASRENAALKEHLAALSKDNHILKRAVQIQNSRQQEAEEKSKEAAALRQMVQQYQEQLRTLEVNNYALSLHLKKAQEQNCMPGRFHPDVF